MKNTIWFSVNYELVFKYFLYLCTHFGGFRNKVLKNKSLTTLKNHFRLVSMKFLRYKI